MLAACLVAKFAELVQPGLGAMLRGFGAAVLLPLAAEALHHYFILHHCRAPFLLILDDGPVLVVGRVSAPNAAGASAGARC